MKKLDYNTIKEKMKNDFGVDLISKNYINSDQKLIYKDSDGYMYYSSWNNISQGKRSSFADKRNIFVMRNIRNYIKINNISSILLSETYDKNLLFRCKCGTNFKKSWDNFHSKGQTVCPKCALKERNNNHRNNKHDMIKLFIDNGYKINNEVYKSTSKIDCFDKDGYRGFISYHKLSCGCTFDRFSFNNPFLVYNINHFMDINNCTATLIKIEKLNKFSNSFLHLKCECGNEYKSKWAIFEHCKVFRCPICSRKQSKYSFLTEKYLKDNNYNFIKEYSFEDCRFISKLFFDFALFINDRTILIEVDGQFHFNDYYGDLSLQILRDEIKNEYCKINNIPLIRIPYWEYKNENYQNILNKEINKYIIESA